MVYVLRCVLACACCLVGACSAAAGGVGANDTAAGGGAGASAGAGAGAPIAGSTPSAGSVGATAPVAGSAALAGSGGAGAGAGAGGATSTTEDACGPVPLDPPSKATPKATVLYGLVEYHTSEDNEFVGVHSTLIVPAKPPPTGILFVWPGTQTLPDTPTYQPVGGGVLQPVLTWGSSCVPGSLPGHDTWWISPVYVNDETSIPDLAGCHGGPVIAVDVGDRLDLEMRLEDTDWYQKVTDLDTTEATEFTVDLRGQPQHRALFWVELKTAAKPTEDLIFEDIVLTMRDPEPGACALNNGGMNDYAAEARVSADGLHCCIDRIVLRAEGVPATTTDP